MEHIFALPVADRWLLHAPLSDLAALVNRAAIMALGEPAQEADTRDVVCMLRSALDVPVYAEPEPRTGACEPQFLGLITTRACNLACRYCGFGASASTSRPMGFDVAVAAVDWMADCMVSLGRDTLTIHFFGGEPMVAHEVVEVAVHRARAVAVRNGLRCRFEIATNGAFGARQAEFLGAYLDSVVLSFDGPREVHDRHRPAATSRGSFEQVARTARRLSGSETALCLRACVTSDSVARMPEIAEWFCTRYRPASITFETLQATPIAAAAGLLPPEPLTFAAAFRAARRIAGGHGVDCVYGASLLNAPRLSFCPVGNDTLIVAPDGSVRGCYLREAEWRDRGLDLRLGELSLARDAPGGAMELPQTNVDRLRRLAAEKPCCHSCFCRFSCAGGCHVNHRYPNPAPDYDDFCVQTRLITACELLDRIGQPHVADRLLAEPAALQALVYRRSDRLEDVRSTSDARENCHV